jgi:hypothetical protein
LGGEADSVVSGGLRKDGSLLPIAVIARDERKSKKITAVQRGLPRIKSYTDNCFYPFIRENLRYGQLAGCYCAGPSGWQTPVGLCGLLKKQ